MKHALVRALRGAHVRFLRVITCSTANVIRGKAASIDCLEDVFAHGVGVTAALPALPVMYDAVVEESGLGPAGEVRLVPDWDTLQFVPYAPDHVQVVGDLMLDGRPWPLDPRDFLKRMIVRARQERLAVQAGYELEFYLLDDRGRSADDTVFAATLGMDVARDVIGEIADALAAQGIVVQQFYPEAGPGQYELPLAAADPLTTADRMLYARQTVHAVARRAGFKAVMLPKIFEKTAGNGAHCHFSLWRDERNIVGDPESARRLSPEAEAFTAGILQHLPALTALTAASPNSYRRLQPGTWSGAFRAWGMDNREAAVRVPSGPDGGTPSHIELKTSDASANPYLALGGLIAAGLDGLRRGFGLPEPIQGDPARLTEAERRDRGLDPLPQALDVSLTALERDQVLIDALGPELARAYIAVKRFEWQELKDLPLEEEVALLMERY
jgi:glutamine synthetase